MKELYFDQLIEIIVYLANNSLNNYNIDDIFKDYGLKNLVKISRKKVEEQGIAKQRLNTIIKEKFDSFPENEIILKVTKLVSNWLKSIDKNQDAFDKNRKNNEKISN